MKGLTDQEFFRMSENRPSIKIIKSLIMCLHFTMYNSAIKEEQ